MICKTMEETIKKTEEETAELKKELARSEEAKQEYLDGWKRAKADFINYKKDEAVRFQTFLKFSNEEMIREMITVLDSFDLAIPAASGNGSELKGLTVIRVQLEETLKRFGLERMDASPGQFFDPARAEAISEMESDKPPGTIAEEAAKGYVLNGKVIRPVRVKISKGPKQ
jgi:molecular chaperone GrpE